MAWADGCAKGFLKGKGKQKQQAVYQVRADKRGGSAGLAGLAGLASFAKLFLSFAWPQAEPRCKPHCSCTLTLSASIGAHDVAGTRFLSDWCAA